MIILQNFEKKDRREDRTILEISNTKSQHPKK